MAQAYSDPSRENDPHALPDIEVWFVSGNDPEWEGAWEDGALERGWYWWSCFPGCIPNGDPIGPFETEAEALADAQA